MHEIEINLKHDVKNVFHLGIIFTRIFDNSGYRWMIYYSRGQRVIGNEKGQKRRVRFIVETFHSK